MYKLGKRLKGKKIRKLHNKIRELTLELTDADDYFATGTKLILENYIFAKKIQPQNARRAFTIDKGMICASLMAARIYVKYDNIEIDYQNNICIIKLNDRIFANIKIKDTTNDCLIL